LEDELLVEDDWCRNQLHAYRIVAGDGLGGYQTPGTRRYVQRW
jgi:hypothetical protein